MDVEIKIANYQGDNSIDFDKPVVLRSVWAGGEFVEIEFEDKKIKVNIDELTSAALKCRLNVFGR